MRSITFSLVVTSPYDQHGNFNQSYFIPTIPNTHPLETLKRFAPSAAHFNMMSFTPSQIPTIARQRITQSFSPNPEISFLPLDEEEGTEGPMIIKAEVGCHFIHRFNGEIIWPLGQISLLVKIRDEEHSTSAWMNFLIVRSSSPYNGIIGRPRIRKIQAVPSTTHGMLKFPVAGGILTLRSSKIIPIECAAVSKVEGQPLAISQAVEERIKVVIHPEYPEQTIMIGSTLTKEGQSKLCDLLRRNLDVFAWKPADMTGVPRHIAEHRLNVRKGCPPVRQNKREVHYHSWLSNPVMVKKHDGCWRMCVDFKDLNKACPKDGYPLLEIDWKVESLCGFPFKCFLDAYKVTTKSRWQKKMRRRQHSLRIGRNLEVYVDDLVIKSHTEGEIIRDIEETFKTLREINMKLNPKKCTFGVEEEMFLGYKVNTKGIKVCPDKVDAVLSLPSLKCLKDVQKLNGELASLNRFLAKSAEKSLPRTLRGPEINYTSMDKLVIALVHASKRLKRYFQAYLIIVVTDQPIKQGQILADFIVERPEDSPIEVEEELPEPWILFTDGSSCVDGSEAGMILTNPEGMEFTYALRFRFEATNNEAKYEALIAGLRIAEQMGVKNLQVNVDSRLVANQVNGTYIAKEADMIQYLEKVKTLTNGFRMFSIKQVPRMLAVVEEEGNTWMTPIQEYLTEEILPIEVDKARAVRRKSQRFAMINGVLYKKSFLGPWIRRKGIDIGMQRLLGSPTDPEKSAIKVDPNHVPMTFYKWGIDIAGPFSEGLAATAVFLIYPIGQGSFSDGMPLGIYGKWFSGKGQQKLRIRNQIKARRKKQRLDGRALSFIPAEIVMPTLRTTKVDVVRNDESIEINLDLVEERTEQAAIREAKSKRKWRNTTTQRSATQALSLEI
ncbi:reverse transcriptase domain-containing protein [Tanacetum coccineum]|uniref:Reverse transcriptase domain-containing protein n=1 Tax=Tanacetum coccineum TaxID=301880 RepID=A0ABQ5BAA1_9ASTR